MSTATLVPLLLIIVVFYFLILRPARNRQREQAATAAKLEVGRKIMTTGGLFGIVTALVDDEVEIEIAPGVRVRYLVAAVAKVIPDEAPDAEQIGLGSDGDIVLDPPSTTSHPDGDQPGH